MRPLGSGNRRQYTLSYDQQTAQKDRSRTHRDNPWIRLSPERIGGKSACIVWSIFGCTGEAEENHRTEHHKRESWESGLQERRSQG